VKSTLCNETVGILRASLLELRFLSI